MGKIIFVLPGNVFHSNMLDDQWIEMDKSHAGLDIIGSSGVPVAVSYQGIDYKMMPWLGGILQKYPSIEIMNAPHSHALAPLQNEELLQWEIRNRVLHSIDVTFFGEFCVPEARYIPTNFFFVLAGSTCFYKGGQGEDFDIVTGSVSNVPAIKHGSKIGIIMHDDDFMGVRKAFFEFQADPITARPKTNDMSPLNFVLNEIRKIGQMPEDKIVVFPMDIEAPYVGSTWGTKIWEMFFKGIIDNGLQNVFVSLSDSLEYFRNNAVEASQPHRIFGKWTIHDVQQNYLRKMRDVTANIKTEYGMLLASIASGSDLLSAWNRKATINTKPQIILGRDVGGNQVKMVVGYNQDMITVPLGAMKALSGNISFEEGLRRQLEIEKRTSNSLFVRRIIDVMKKEY